MVGCTDTAQKRSASVATFTTIPTVSTTSTLLNMKREGSRLLVQWPTPNVFESKPETYQLDFEIIKHQQSISYENIGGVSACLSSKGWVGRKTKIVSLRKNLKSRKIKNVSLEKLEQVFVNLEKIVETLKKKKMFETFSEVLLFGMFVLEESSKIHDLDKKKEKPLPGDFLIYGFGFVSDSKSDVQASKTAIVSFFNNAIHLKTKKKKTIFISFANMENARILDAVELKTVSFLNTEILSKTLNNREYFLSLKKQLAQEYFLEYSEEYQRLEFPFRFLSFNVKCHVLHVVHFLKNFSVCSRILQEVLEMQRLSTNAIPV